MRKSIPPVSRWLVGSSRRSRSARSASLAREPHAVALADGQGRELAVPVAAGAEARERDVDPAVRVPHGEVLGAGEDLRELGEVARLVVEVPGRRLELGGDRPQPAQRRGDERADRLARRDGELLLDERERARAAHLPAAGYEVPGEHVQERRLARAVLPHDPEPRPRGDAEPDPVEDGASGVGEGEVVGGEVHGDHPMFREIDLAVAGSTSRGSISAVRVDLAGGVPSGA